MPIRAMSISISGKALGLCLLAAALSVSTLTPAAAQDSKKQGSVKEDVKDVAETPLEDVGISKDEIPEILIIAARDPYVSEGLTTCNALVGEIAKLDTVLGEDYDLAGEEDTGMNKKSAAKSVVGSLIPFRGVVREVSGAAGAARKNRAAVTAGMVRRGYLKGLGQARGCKYPARPKADRPKPDASK